MAVYEGRRASPCRPVSNAMALGLGAKDDHSLAMQSRDNHMRLTFRRSLGGLFRRLTSTVAPGTPPPPTHLPFANEVARKVGRNVDSVPIGTVNEVFLGVPITAHILGGCPMGADAKEGVIGRNHEVFGHPGLFVCDGSAIPANLGVNPSLTITALTEYAWSRYPDKQDPS